MIQLLTPKHRASDSKAYGYVTDGAYEWQYRSYISDNDAMYIGYSAKNSLSWDGINSEAYLDDILVADSSTRNPMYARNGQRMAYGYIPFILQNAYATAIYDLGFLFYSDPSARIAEAIAGSQGYTTYLFADGASSVSNATGDAAHGANKFNAFADDSIGLYVMGVMSSSNWNLGAGTEATGLKNLSNSTYWTSAPYAALTPSSGRVILNPQQYQDARVWWENGSTYASMNELGMSINNYRIKHWNDGGYRSSLINRGVSPAPAISDSIRIPSNGCVWGYMTVAVTDAKTSVAQVSVGGNAFKLVTHGRWTTQDLAAEPSVLQTGVIEPWNANGATSIPSRLWRYGLHVVAKKE